MAFLNQAGELKCFRESSVDNAVCKIFSEIPENNVLGMGIDAPMWWSSKLGGGRKSDILIRKNVIEKSTVLSGNSLSGAALIGGMLLALRIREKYPQVKITESHPKALLQTLIKKETGEITKKDLKNEMPKMRQKFPEMYQISNGWPSNEDEQDAAVASVCAREGITGRWKTDLAKDKYRYCELEQNPEEYFLKPMHYFWPDDLN
ncbi:MAG: hypothetical protein OXF46_11445 [Rhodobacteraceae bacterium]|nr:hypothetical protein [Paracoccaceae bacterium]